MALALRLDSCTLGPTRKSARELAFRAARFPPREHRFQDAPDTSLGHGPGGHGQSLQERPRWSLKRIACLELGSCKF